MSKDRKLLYSLSTILLILLSLSFFVPAIVGRIVVAVLFVVFAFVFGAFFKKRNVLSINKKTVLILMSAISLLYITLLYFTGIKFGFYKAKIPVSFISIVKIIIPTIIIIVSCEFVRYVLISQEDKVINFITFAICFFADILICTNVRDFETFNNFMDLVGMVILPMFISNILFTFLVKNYGIYPNIIYKVITILYVYIIPVQPNVPEALLAIIKLLLPLVIYIFINSLYKKKLMYKEVKSDKWNFFVYGILGILSVAIIMVVSCKFKYCALVIATDSMQDEINIGDMIIYEQYDNQAIKKGDIIVYQKHGSTIVHRVVDIRNINGEIQYYTKGDANASWDEGFITDSNIIGCLNFKISYLGYPTILLRNIFD